MGVEMSGRLEEGDDSTSLFALPQCRHTGVCFPSSVLGHRPRPSRPPPPPTLRHHIPRPSSRPRSQAQRRSLAKQLLCSLSRRSVAYLSQKQQMVAGPFLSFSVPIPDGLHVGSLNRPHDYNDAVRPPRLPTELFRAPDSVCYMIAFATRWKHTPYAVRSYSICPLGRIGSLP